MLSTLSDQPEGRAIRFLDLLVGMLPAAVDAFAMVGNELLALTASALTVTGISEKKLP